MQGSTDILFEVMTPLGFAVRVTKSYWELISTLKHPVMRSYLEEVKTALQGPDEIRLRKSDRQVYFFTNHGVPDAGCVR